MTLTEIKNRVLKLYPDARLYSFKYPNMKTPRYVVLRTPPLNNSIQEVVRTEYFPEGLPKSSALHDRCWNIAEVGAWDDMLRMIYWNLLRGRPL